MISNIKILVELFAYLYCLAKLFDRKLKISIHMVVLIILDLFLLTGINNYGFPAYLRSLLYIGMFLYGLLYYGETIKKTLVNCFLAAMIVTILQLVLCLPTYYLVIARYGQSNVNELLINVVCLLIIIGCSKKVNIKKLSDFVVKRNKIIIIVSFLVLIGLGSNLYHIRKSGVFFREQYIQIVYFLFLFGFTIHEWQKSKMEAEKKKAQLEMNKMYYDAYDQLILLIRERQHDMRNHINAILSMIYTTDNYEELVEKQKKYCDYVMGQNEKTRLLLSAGNPLIAGFLHSKIQEAEKKGIEVTYKIDLKKKELSIPEYELIEMIGILFDNAVEALSEDAELEKKMEVSILETEEQLELAVVNATNLSEEEVEALEEKFFEVGYSTKGAGRGIGLSKLKKLVQEKDGDIMVYNEMEEEKNNLVFVVLLPI